MPRQNESFAEYKTRIIDPISESFCAAKWLNATIWLGNGQTTSCHHPLGHQIDAKELVENPTAIHNTPHKKLMRKMMQAGIRPQECEYCWKIEDLGRNNISDRAYKTAVFKDEHILEAAASDWRTNTMLRTLEISFDRTCNFACSYCNPSFSTTWVKDIHKFGPYRNINGDARSHFINEAPHSKPIPDEKNPYTQAFWRWWDQGLSDELEEIRITGGEPLMAPGVWKLFEWFKNNQNKVRNRKAGILRYAINTNLVPKDDIMNKLIEYSHYVPHLEIYTSGESKGKHGEYIRDGLDYNKWLYNLNRLHTEGNIKKTHLMMTINSLCLASITEFMDDIIDFKVKHQTVYPTMSLNILRFPSFQSCAMLPVNIRQKYKEKLQSWLDDQIEKNTKVLLNGHTHPVLMSIEIEQTQRLIDYLDIIKTPHKNVINMPQQQLDFKNFYYQYDIRRGKDFRSTFPSEFIEWFDNIEAEIPTKEEILSKSYSKTTGVIPIFKAEDPSSEAFINPDLN